jgi:hypothetical protein
MFNACGFKGVAPDLFEFKAKKRSVLPAHEHFQRRNRANQGMT